MATNRNAPEGYEPSRAALRRMYGTRRIDASAPFSAADTTPSAMDARDRGFRDTTPSGRMRERVAAGMTPMEAKQVDASQFQSRFQPTPIGGATSGRPLTMLMNRRAPTSTLDAIESMQSSGAPDAVIPSLGTGSYLAAARPSLMPESPVADASDLGGFSPSSSFTPLSFFKPRPRPSILTGAQNWIAQV